MKTDTSEKGLENLIVAVMTRNPTSGPVPANAVKEPTTLYGQGGWILGDWHDYDREYAIDLKQLSTFLATTQPQAHEALNLESPNPTRQKFLARLQGEISNRGVIDVLRHGVKHGPLHLDLFYGTPTPGNTEAGKRYAQNHFSNVSLFSIGRLT